jgi:signal transduction histidine kinase
MECLVATVQQLSLARSLDAVAEAVRVAARDLTGADGATFVVRDGDHCYYADEDAIAPLWKGSRFPMESCISGWVMQHRQAVVIEDIYTDERVPHDAYRPTFVKSMAMVPIRTADPLGAIGNYWAQRHVPSATDLQLLQALADSTAVALENVGVYAELEQRVERRTAELSAANVDLDNTMHSAREFIAVIAHDLGGPLSTIRLGAALLRDETVSDAQRKEVADAIDRQAGQLGRLVDDLTTLSVIDAGQIEVRPERVGLRGVVELASAELGSPVPVMVDVDDGLTARADPAHVQRIVGNLLRNAVRHGAQPISVAARREGAAVLIEVVDQGPGVAPEFVPHLFRRFSRPRIGQRRGGSGLGLSIVRELAVVNGGDVAYEPGRPVGARFQVRLPAAGERAQTTREAWPSQ